MRSCRRFLGGIPHRGVGHPRVPHPSATPSPLRERAFDLHVLGTPPAFILSQDQTRHPSLKLTGILVTLYFYGNHSSVVQVRKSMLPHLVRPFGASEIIPLYLSDVKRFFLEFPESTNL